MKLDDAWLEEMKKRGLSVNDPRDRAIGSRAKGKLSSLVPDPEPEIILKRRKAAAHTWGKMNATEARYAAHLAATRPHAKVYFEEVTLKLGHDCRLTPDFLVEEPTACGCGEDSAAFHEVKGRRKWEDSIVKLRVAAAKFSLFTFYMCEEIDGVWRVKLVPPE